MDLEFEVNKLNIQDGDTVVIKSNSVTIEQMGRLHELLNGGSNKVNVIRLNLNDDIQSLSEDQMNQAGWYKKSN